MHFLWYANTVRSKEYLAHTSTHMACTNVTSHVNELKYTSLILGLGLARRYCSPDVFIAQLDAGHRLGAVAQVVCESLVAASVLKLRRGLYPSRRIESA